MTKLRSIMARLRGDASGSAVVEMGIGLPLLASFVYGMLQVSIIFLANSGVQHSLGEGARYATLYIPANLGPPSDSEIAAKITAKKFGPKNGSWAAPSITTDAATNTKTITVTYTQPTDFLFMEGPDVNITKTKRVHLSNAASGAIT